MSAAVHAHPQSGPALGVDQAGNARRVLSEAGQRGRWWRFIAIPIITAVVLVPIMVTIVLAFTPGPNSTATGLTFENLSNVFSKTLAATWLKNSLVTTLSTVVVSVAVALPRRSGQPTESISLTSPVEAASEEALKAGVPELKRAAGRLAELLEGSVY